MTARKDGIFMRGNNLGSSKAIALSVVFLLACHPEAKEYNNMSFPPGIRLNNPGDIERTHIDWNGMTRLQDHPKFVRFKSPYYGIRAIMKVLLAYKNIHGIDTISTIINRYAPPEDGNFTTSYINDVSERTGFFPNEVLNIKENYTLVVITKAIIIHEQGIAPLQFPEAWYDESLFYQIANELLKEDEEKEKEYDKT